MRRARQLMVSGVIINAGGSTLDGSAIGGCSAAACFLVLSSNEARTTCVYRYGWSPPTAAAHATQVSAPLQGWCDAQPLPAVE